MKTSIEEMEKCKEHNISPVAMKICKQKKIWSNNSQQINIVINEYKEKIKTIEHRQNLKENRKANIKENNYFEWNRRIFYRNLTNEKQHIEESLEDSEIISYWEQIYRNKVEYKEGQESMRYIEEGKKIETCWNEKRFRNELEKAIKSSSNWKTPGHDGIFNFFIKYLASLHEKLKDIVVHLIENPEVIPDCMCTGMTYLILKENQVKTPEKIRPITCLPNVFKLITKVVSRWLYEFYNINSILSENQMGARSRCQGAKEQAMTNINLNSAHGGKLKACWIDVAKAYDTVNHQFLLECLKKFNVPKTIYKFIQLTLSKQKLTILRNNTTIGKITLERGLIQGDSLSPLLFVTYIEPLSRMLNTLEKVCVQNEDNTTCCINHLIFIDDIKLFATAENRLEIMCNVTNKYFSELGMKINEMKSAKNTESEKIFGKILNEENGYKYLGILENSSGVKTEEVKKQIKEKILYRTKKIANTKLNAKNIIRAINEFALSPINYYIGIVEYKPEEIEELDRNIRKILIANKIHAQDACKERLYLSKEKMGRGMIKMEFKYEKVLFTLQTYLKRNSPYNTKLKMIAEAEKKKNSTLNMIYEILKIKYQLNEGMTLEEIGKKQEERLMEIIKLKPLHYILYNMEEGSYDMKQSAQWIMEGNIDPRTERKLMRIQDRNCFYEFKGKCPGVKKQKLQLTIWPQDVKDS
ncbi:hypothetical protein ENBRE01_1615 [Enteropsectra breve]|nr:hypothetical protein ENBRE01_1615 [Enteropsectra breve]